MINKRIQGFVVTEHLGAWTPALHELGTMVAAGKLVYRESIAEGIAAAPDAFIGLLKGKNFGTQRVRLA